MWTYLLIGLESLFVAKLCECASCSGCLLHRHLFLIEAFSPWYFSFQSLPASYIISATSVCFVWSPRLENCYRCSQFPCIYHLKAGCSVIQFQFVFILFFSVVDSCCVVVQKWPREPTLAFLFLNKTFLISKLFLNTSFPEKHTFYLAWPPLIVTWSDINSRDTLTFSKSTASLTNWVHD